MHELSVCQGLLRQVGKVAAEHEAHGVSRILLRVGALSGVEPDLLKRGVDGLALATEVHEQLHVVVGRVERVVADHQVAADTAEV